MQSNVNTPPVQLRKINCRKECSSYLAVSFVISSFLIAVGIVLGWSSQTPPSFPSAILYHVNGTIRPGNVTMTVTQDCKTVLKEAVTLHSENGTLIGECDCHHIKSEEAFVFEYNVSGCTFVKLTNTDYLQTIDPCWAIQTVHAHTGTQRDFCTEPTDCSYHDECSNQYKAYFTDKHELHESCIEDVSFTQYGVTDCARECTARNCSVFGTNTFGICTLYATDTISDAAHYKILPKDTATSRRLNEVIEVVEVIDVIYEPSISTPQYCAGWCNIYTFDQCARMLSRLVGAGHRDNERDVDKTFKEFTAFVYQSVVTQHFPVVAGKYDHGIFDLTRACEVRDNASKLCVNVFNHC